MIAFSLFWFAIPLAIFGAIALRMTVATFLMIDPPRPQPATPRTSEPESKEPAPTPMVKEMLTGTDITATAPARKEGITSIPTVTHAAEEGEDDTEEETPTGPMQVPPFKAAWALLVVVLVGTACMAAFARMVVLAIVAILQSKGMVGEGDFCAIFTAVEAMLLPLGLLLLARLLRDFLPTTFTNACLIVLLSLVVFCVVVAAIFGLLNAVIAFFSWCFSFYRL